MVQLDVHLVEGLLHMLRMYRSDLNETFSVTPHRTDCADCLFRSMGRAQKPDRVEILQPLTVRDVSFSPRNVLDMSSVNKTHAKTAIFQDLEKRNPEHPCRFHSHACDATQFEPIRDPYEIVCKR